MMFLFVAENGVCSERKACAHVLSEQGENLTERIEDEAEEGDVQREGVGQARSVRRGTDPHIFPNRCRKK